LHVLKGALEKTMGIRWTTSVFTNGEKGRLAVKFDRNPTPEELKRVESEANQKVAENVEIIEFEMDKDEAERHFGDAIYDVFPLPPGLTRLSIVRIPDWNVNCCNKKHAASTGEVGNITIEKTRFRGSKEILEIGYRVE
jgi:alanyl-tRNA synthetase